MSTVTLGREVQSEGRSLWQVVAEGWRYVTHYAPAKPQAAKVRVSCSQGAVWVTRSDDNRDYIVRAGETLILESTGRILATELRSRGEAVYRVEQFH